jgi:hypothetical protein
MITILFNKDKKEVHHLGIIWQLIEANKADDLAVDVVLEADGNQWYTSFNAQSVVINAIKWNSSDELLAVINQ